MSELTDLEICKRIAEIESFEFNVKTLFTGGPIGVWPKCDFKHVGMSVESGSYNPLTDDALCFKLMVKYEVERTWELYDFIGWNYHCEGNKNPIRITERTYFGEGEETPDLTTNKAICLAIIEAHK